MPLKGSRAVTQRYLLSPAPIGVHDADQVHIGHGLVLLYVVFPQVSDTDNAHSQSFATHKPTIPSHPSIVSLPLSIKVWPRCRISTP